MSTPPRRQRINRSEAPAEVVRTTRRETSSARPKRLKDCRICNKDHPLRKCLRFRRLSTASRYKVVRRYKYCTNCLAHSHTLMGCQCRDRCKICLAEHHTLLHKNERRSPRPNQNRNRRQHPQQQHPPYVQQHPQQQHQPYVVQQQYQQQTQPYQLQT